ncbi:MAG: YybS family protein [Desulfobacteraceae bacterium]
MSKPTEKNRMLKEIFTGITVSVLLFTATIAIPLLGFFIALVLPMPILVYRLKLGRQMGGVIALAVFCVIMVMTGGMYVDLLFYGALLLTGFFLGEYLEKPLSLEKTGLYTCLTTLGFCALGVFLYSVVTGENLVSMVSDYVAKNIEITLKLYSEMGVPQENIDTITGAMDTVQYVLVRLLPALTAAMVIFETWINLLFIKKFLAKKQIFFARLERLNQWRAPEQLVWLAILFGLLIALPGRPLKITGLNLVIVLMPIYFFQGIAIVSFFFEKKRFPRFLRILIYGIIAIQQIFLFLVMGLGFFDTWINFRKLDTMEEEEPDE